MTVDVSNVLTVLGAAGSTAFTLWAHGREFNKEKRRTLQEYGAAQVEANGIKRDIDHIKRDLAQLSANVAHLDDENEARFRAIEADMARLSGSLNVLLMQQGQGGHSATS
ncbi:MAG: hypothetical protein AAGB19_00465 [Cyanobacteria bacterium P01_F01_bin.3]